MQLLDSQKINYTTFNVIGENDVREILKETARYNSFPQLYVNGKFICGLSQFEQIVAARKMPNYIPTTEIKMSIREKLNTLIRKGCYMIFLHGNPKFPRDQRSRKLMEVIKNHYPWVIDNKINPDENLEHFDLSRDKDIEIMLAKYIKFSEIPQFYVDGHLIGGLEIIENLHSTN